MTNEDQVATWSRRLAFQLAGAGLFMRNLGAQPGVIEDKGCNSLGKWKHCSQKNHGFFLENYLDYRVLYSNR